MKGTWLYYVNYIKWTIIQRPIFSVEFRFKFQLEGNNHLTTTDREGGKIVPVRIKHQAVKMRGEVEV
jgi:hypothetical protein